MVEKKSTTKTAATKKTATKKAPVAKKTTAAKKAAGISTEDTILGLGWLFKEGKIKDEDNKVALA